MLLNSPDFALNLGLKWKSELVAKKVTATFMSHLLLLYVAQWNLAVVNSVSACVWVFVCVCGNGVITRPSSHKK